MFYFFFVLFSRLEEIRSFPFKSQKSSSKRNGVPMFWQVKEESFKSVCLISLKVKMCTDVV